MLFKILSVLTLLGVCFQGGVQGGALKRLDAEDCTYADEEASIYYDLSPLGVRDYVVNQPGTTYNIQLNPCEPLITVPTGNVCNKETMACQLDTSNQNSSAFLLATEIEEINYINTTDSLELKLFGGSFCQTFGTSRNVIITYTCGTNGIGMPVFVAEEQCSYQFSWASNVTCKSTTLPIKNDGLSAGSILCILFFCSLAVYFIAGSIYRYQKKEARGIEMIPNIDFWRGLPSLVKDGMTFTYNKIYGLFNKEHQPISVNT